MLRHAAVGVQAKGAALQQQESAVLEDVDTDDEWIDGMGNSSKSSLDTEV
jgi:hypothetical protein